MNDPYEGGTLKYQTAQDIYDALCELVQTEEMGILSEMFADVSYDNQGYYYTDKGYALKDKFEELSDYCDKMWLMDLAVWQIEDGEVGDIVYGALYDEGMAKRIGFKKLFIDHLLYGNKALYDEISEDFRNAISELDRFDYYLLMNAFTKIGTDHGWSMITTPYPEFTRALYKKVQGLELQEEKQLIAECRAHLNAYDDFMYGLRMNQVLYEGLENQYRNRVAALNAAFDEKLRQLMMIAERSGIQIEGIETVNLLEG